MNRPLTCPNCQAELPPGESVCIRCGQPLKPKLNWWVDVGLLLAGPCATSLAAAMDYPPSVPEGMAVWLPLPFGLILGFRTARRITLNENLRAFLAIFLSGIFGAVILYLSVLGCTFSGDGF